MRLSYNDTKRGRCYYIIRSVYKGGKNTSERVETLGYLDEIKEQHQCDDPMEWIESHLADLNKKEKDDKNVTVLVPFNSSVLIKPNEKNSYLVGHLFLQQIYYQLKIDLICKHITQRHSFKYDFNAIVSSLIYGRILFPSSKLATCKQARDLIDAPDIKYCQVLYALKVIAQEFDFIQSELYKYSAQLIPRKTGVLYYDCTNFYFETEQEDDISNEEADKKGVAARKYGYSKQHQPSPLVQMGMFMDYSGIPLAICINRGNENEQMTLVPLEEKILSDFELSRFVVCTDSGLSSDGNRKFNNFGERSFVTTVSIKKMEAKLTEWCLDPAGWKLEGSDKLYNINDLEKTDEAYAENYDKIFYKEKYIEGYDEERDIEFNQTLMVTYSIKYKHFLQRKREGQIERARNAINDSRVDKRTATDYRRFIKKISKDADGKDVKISYAIDQSVIDDEKKYDGFYAVETNLDDSVGEILKINKGRWEIEESFRIMKDDFLSRPVYLSQSDKIKAHFMTCFMALLVYRVLEKKTGSSISCERMLETLRSMRMTKVKDTGYIPSYTRDEVTDQLHDVSGFRTDYEIIREKAMKGIIRKSKQR